MAQLPLQSGQEIFENPELAMRAALAALGINPRFSRIGSRMMQQAGQLQNLAYLTGQPDRNSALQDFQNLSNAYARYLITGDMGNNKFAPDSLMESANSALNAGQDDWRYNFMREGGEGDQLNRVQALQNMGRAGMLPGVQNAYSGMTEDKWNAWYNEKLRTGNDPRTFIDVMAGRPLGYVPPVAQQSGGASGAAGSGGTAGSTPTSGASGGAAGVGGGVAGPGSVGTAGAPIVNTLLTKNSHPTAPGGRYLTQGNVVYDPTKDRYRYYWNKAGTSQRTPGSGAQRGYSGWRMVQNWIRQYYKNLEAGQGPRLAKWGAGLTPDQVLSAAVNQLFQQLREQGKDPNSAGFSIAQ